MSQQPNLNHCRVIPSPGSLTTFVNSIKNADKLILSTYTDGLNFMTSKLLGLWIYYPVANESSLAQNPCVFIPFDESVNVCVISYEDAEHILAPLTKIPVIVDSWLFDMGFIQRYLHLDFKCAWDVKLAAKSIYEKEPHPELINLCRKYIPDISEIELPYLGECELIYKLYEAQNNIIYYDCTNSLAARNGMNGSSWVFQNIEMPSLCALQQMGSRGLSVDVDGLSQLITDKESLIANRSDMIFKFIEDFKCDPKCTCVSDCEYILRTRDFDMTSQLHRIFNNIVGAVIPDMSYETLEKVTHPLILDYIDYRRNSAELKALQRLNSLLCDGRVYPMYLPYSNASGGISTRDPYLMALRKYTYKIFVASPDHYMCTVSYSMLILYVWAALSPEPYRIQILDLLNGDKDFYSEVASQIFDIPYEDVVETSGNDTKYRNAVKCYIIDALLGHKNQKKNPHYKLTNAEFKVLYKGIASKFPSLGAFIDNSIDFCTEHGYVASISGRRINEPDIWVNITDKATALRYDLACRRSVSARIIGSISDLHKYTMFKLNNDTTLAELGYKVLTVLYDDVVGECPKENAAVVRKLILKKTLQYAEELFGIPVKCDVEITNTLYGDTIDV